MAKSGRRAGNRISVNLPPKKASVKKARRLAEKFALSHGFQSEANDIKLAVQEACKNVVEHCGSSDRSMNVTCTRKGQRIIVDVKDRGEGFDTSILEEKPPVLSSHGRGISIMRGLMDDLSIKSGRRGTTVHMEKECSGGDGERMD